MYPSPPDITSIDLFSPFPGIELEPPLDGERGSVFDDGLDDEGEVFADIADNPPWPRIDICSKFENFDRYMIQRSRVIIVK